MKSLNLVLSAVLISASLAFAQTAAPPTQQSGAQKSFDELKTLAGVWLGPVTTDPKMGDEDKVRVTLRVTSRGNAIVHEMHDPNSPDDPTKYDHPVTMLYLDEDRLLLTHYCDAGNRPRMVAKSSPDGKRIEFDFLDLSGGNENGHMANAIFTIIDANHHTEDWIYLMPGDKKMHAHMDLTRVSAAAAFSSTGN